MSDYWDALKFTIGYFGAIALGIATLVCSVAFFPWGLLSVALLVLLLPAIIVWTD